MSISLMGYMGSGKTLVSNILCKKTGIKKIDLDDYISSKINSSIPEIFAKKGEIYFRKTEHEYLKEILSTEKDLILSLGGGTPVYYNNIDIINQYSKSFYLRASVKTLAERLISEKSNRPMIARIADADLPEFIAKHLFERNSFYNKANFTIDVDNKTPEEIAEEIIKSLL